MARSRKTTPTNARQAGGSGETAGGRRTRYVYSPHLAPVLRFDPTSAADRALELVGLAGQRVLTASEQAVLRECLRGSQPWLEWAAKQEQHDRGGFEVDPVVLHVHERVSAQAILNTAARRDAASHLFADPQPPHQELVRCYRHDGDWSNRLILGDSLPVMAALASREDLAGKVQTIYMDPPYGIRFASNFQPELRKRDVGERDQDLSRELETVRAYRDTWHLGVHSYLSYLRDRLILARRLLHDTGSIFVQISDENLHRVRLVLDEVFGADNFVSLITVKKTGGMGERFLDNVSDYLLWYAADREQMKYRPLYLTRELTQGAGARFTRIELAEGWSRPILGAEREDPGSMPQGARPWRGDPLTSDTGSESTIFDFDLEGETIRRPKNGGWKTNAVGMARLARAGRIIKTRGFVNFKKYFGDFAATPLGNLWADTMGTAEQDKVYVVQTTTKVVQRCILMTTDPGDLVLDPTAGSGTTAYVAEQWGRRWIAMDTSRVAIATARQRLLTARFEHYALGGERPSAGFVYQTIPHVMLKDIARNSNLDPIITRHEPLLDAALAAVRAALDSVSDEHRRTLVDRQRREGKRAGSDADERRWGLFANHSGKRRLEHWTVPFDTDPDWPAPLIDAVTAYRRAWRARRDEVDACIAANAEQEALVDQPRVIKGVVRVSGGFTVEGVHPAERSPDEDGEHGPAINEDLRAYLLEMVRLLRHDGLTFTGSNVARRFARLDPLFEQGTGSELHAEGTWRGAGEGERASVAVAFGPQYGPVTARQVEGTVRAASRFDELILAGFSFAPEATAAIESSQRPGLRVHQAQVRPDVNPGMAGLLKDTIHGQLFTVFGQPEIAVAGTSDGWVVSLLGVDLYDPVENTLRSTRADKVAAWFLDSDFDGRCFCITQAFFPDQSAWHRLARSLRSQADERVFAALAGTVSLPFSAGTHGRIAVKVIDPRGNEVMAIRTLGA